MDPISDAVKHHATMQALLVTGQVNLHAHALTQNGNLDGARGLYYMQGYVYGFLLASNKTLRDDLITGVEAGRAAWHSTQKKEPD